MVGWGLQSACWCPGRTGALCLSFDGSMVAQMGPGDASDGELSRHTLTGQLSRPEPVPGWSSGNLPR